MSINIDELTLQCFVNKHTYNKYLAKHNPLQYQETKDLYGQLQDQKETIHQILDHFMDEPDSDKYDITLRSAFETLMKGIVYHIHHVTKEKEYQEKEYEKEEEKELILFGSIQDDDSIPYWNKYPVRKER